MIRNNLDTAQQYVTSRVGQTLGYIALSQTVLGNLIEYSADMRGTFLGRTWSLKIKAKF